MNILIDLNHQFRVDDQPVLEKVQAIAEQHPGSRLVFFHSEKSSVLSKDPDFFIPPHRTKRIRGPHQTRIALQALEELSSELAKDGIPLVCFWDHDRDEAIRLINDKLKVDEVFICEESRLFSDWPIARENFPFVFTDFRKQLRIDPDHAMPHPLFKGWENSLNIFPQEWLNVRTLDKFGFESSNDERSTFPFKGGETSARERLKSYFYNTFGLRNYKLTRNGLIGTEYSSKFSPFLAIGCLSARRIWTEILRYESQEQANDGSEWMKFELLWREFFLWSEQKQMDTFYDIQGLQKRSFEYDLNTERFLEWTHAETGQDFVDANIRELNTTGFISNRGRQIVASYFVNDLKLPWHWGARYFEWMLVDASSSQNYGNWAYLAGVGSDPRSFGNAPRYFSLEKQTQTYDPEGTYQKLWDE